MKIFNVLIVFVLVVSSADAQILGRIMDEASRKIERRIEDKIVQAVSDELVKRAFRPIEASIDSMLRQKYQDSLSAGRPIDWEKAGADYADFLKGMNESIDLPVKYTFDITQEIEIVDYNKKRSFVKIHYSKNENIMGMETTDNDQNTSLVVIDVPKDAMILLNTDRKGKKTGQVVPSVSKWTSTLMRSAPTDNNAEMYDVVATGKSKKIAGYKSNEYKGNSKEEKITLYITGSLPVESHKSIQVYFASLAPQAYNDNMKAVTDSGIIMEFENSRLDENGEKTTWVTKKVTEKSFDLVNADYGL